MLPLRYGKSAWWFRFTDYETFKNENGVYIIPAARSEIINFNPFDYAADLSIDYLKYGKAVIKGMKESDKIDEAVNLVKKYGLLGIYTFTQYRTDLLKSRNNGFAIHVYDDYDNFVGEKTFQDFLYEYFPLSNRQPPSIGESNNLTKLDILQFEKNYSERVGWIASKAVTLYNNFKNISDFKNISEIENVPDTEYFNKVIDCRLHVKNTDMVIEYDEISGATLNWLADNLFTMIDIAYALKVIDTKKGLAECKNCGDPFIKSRRNGEYCTSSCGNTYRVKKSNNKKKGVKTNG